MGLKTKFYLKLLSLGPFGYEILRSYKNLVALRSSGYQRISPLADYAPWKKDVEFLDIFKKIKRYTLVDIYRCYELWALVEQISKLEGSIIEVGVWRGGTGALIAKKAELCGIKENVYLCDTFTGVVKASSQDSLYKGGEHRDTSREFVEKLIHDRLKLYNAKILQGIFPDDTSESIENEIFKFCHIDVDVYQSARDITEWIWSKMVIGGVIVFDDYGFFGSAGITKYVEELKLRDDSLLLHNLNGHAVIVKIK
jgi:O-methyltransferase